MKRIGYILGLRMRGPVDLGPLGSLIVALTGRFGGILSVTDTTAAPNGLTGSIQTMGGIGVMGQSSFESTARFQGDVIFNGRILAGGEINNSGPCILNGGLSVVGAVIFGGVAQFRVLGPAALDNADVRLNNLPGGAPVEVGRLWNNGGVVTIV